jgi:hypothetical protein
MHETIDGQTRRFDGNRRATDGGRRTGPGGDRRVGGQVRRAPRDVPPLRQDFLDPFFEALGWDVYNRQGFAEVYRDVILEQSLRVE